MTQRQAWSLTGVAPEAREAARAAAQVEGISVGEWLKRRILAEDGDTSDSLMPRPRLVSSSDEDIRRRRVADRAASLANESDSDFASRHIDDAVTAMANLLEANERSQSDAKRAMSSFASEIKAAAHDQATAFQDLNERIDRVERSSDTANLRTTVNGLGQGLSKLTDQAARNVADIKGQIGTLSETLKTLTGKVSSAREESNRLGLFVQDQLSTFAERVRSNEGRIAHYGKVEDAVGALGKRVAALGQVEKSIAELGERDTRAMRQIDDVAGNLELLEGQLSSTRAETDRIAGRLNAAEARLALYSRVEIAVEALRNRLAGLDQIERSISELGERDTEATRTLNALAGNVETLAGQIASQRENSSQIAQRMRSAEGNIANYSQVQEIVEMLRRRIAALGKIEESISELNQRDAEAKRNFDALNGSVEALSGKVSSAHEDSHRLAERLGSAEGRMAHFSEVENTIELLRKRTAGLGQLAEEFGRREADAMKQIEALAGNLDTLSGKLSSAQQDSTHLAERIASTEGRVAQFSKLEGAVDKLNKRVAALDAVEKAALELRKSNNDAALKIDSLGGNLKSLTDNFDSLAKKFASGREESNRLDERMRSAEGRIERQSKVEETVDGLRKRITGLDEIEKSLTDLRQALAGQASSSRQDSEKISARVQATEAGIASLAKLEDAVASLKKRLSGLGAMEKSIADISERDADAVRQMDSLVADLAALTGKVSSAEAESTHLADRVQSAEAQAARVVEVEKAVVALTKRFAGLEENQKSLAAPGKSEAVQTGKPTSAQSSEQAAYLASRQSQMEDAVQTLNKRVAGLDGIEKSVAEFDKRNGDTARLIDQLTDNLSSVASTVSSAREEVNQIAVRLHAAELRLSGAAAAEGGQSAAHDENFITLSARVEENERRRAENEGHVRERISRFEKLLTESEKNSRQMLAELRAGLQTMASRLSAIEELEPTLAGAVQPAMPAPSIPVALPPSLPVAPMLSPPESEADDEADDTFQPDSDSWSPEPFAGEPLDLEPPEVDDEAELPPIAEAEIPPAPEQFAHSDTETRLPAKDQAYLAQARRAALATMDGTEKASLARTPGKGSQERRLFSGGRVAVVCSLLALIPAGYFLGRSWTSPTTDIVATPSGIDQIAAPVSATPGSEASPSASSTQAANNTYASFEDALVQANMGDIRAMLMLGVAYADGVGVAQNDAQAAVWLRRAAQMGDAMAQYRLGVRLERGIGIDKDPMEAAHWYSEAAEHGNGRAMYNLAVAYANGAGIDKNLGEALRWFQSASELGLTDSQFNLAVMYERGMGVSASLTEAYKWYAIAQAGGDMESKARVEALATQITAAQKGAADEAVASFKAKPMNREANEAPQLGRK